MLGSGSPCYVAQAQYYDQAFETFFQRLAADGITPKNTLFVVSSDEGDHEAGANVGRSIQPTPANCDGAVVAGTTTTSDVPCTYPSGSFGELAANVTGLLAAEKGDTTPFALEDDTAPEFYVTGQPGPDEPAVRQLERDTGSLTASNPYSGNANETLANYLADPTEEAILHMVNADPARTPTFTMFTKPDYYVSSGPASCSGSCVTQDSAFAWDHGDYAGEINNNYVGFVGPGVKPMGLDGSGPAAGPNSAGPDSGQETVIQQSAANPGTWVDETDIQPTLMYLAGLKDDYTPDGRVIAEILAHPTARIGSAADESLGACYKQMNSSVGEFGTWTLEAATSGIESGSSASDSTYVATDAALSVLEQFRDNLADVVKQQLFDAEFNGVAINWRAADAETSACEFLLGQAETLASGFSLSPAVVHAGDAPHSSLTATRAREVTSRVHRALVRLHRELGA